VPDFKTTQTPGLLLLLCDQGLQVERGLAGALLGCFANVIRSGLRLTLRWAFIAASALIRNRPR